MVGDIWSGLTDRRTQAYGILRGAFLRGAGLAPCGAHWNRETQGENHGQNHV